MSNYKTFTLGPGFLATDDNVNRIYHLLVTLFLFTFICNSAFASDIKSRASFDCFVDPSSFTDPSMPQEVKTNRRGSSDFCDFYQFSWQAFAYLMSKDSQDNYRFLDTEKYRDLQVDDNGNPVNSCDDIPGNNIFMAIDNTRVGGTQQAIPKRITQAGGANIYDQERNVILYDIRFSDNMCNTDQLLSQKNFAEKGRDKIDHVTEIKAAWKVLTRADNPDQYVIYETDINGVTHDDFNGPISCKTEGSNKDCFRLGLLGFHIVIFTPDHPEGVWQTFEHILNAPDCRSSDQRTSGWSMAGKACTQGLNHSDTLALIQSRPQSSGSVRKAKRAAKSAIKEVLRCNLNNPAGGQTNLTEKSTEICREYPYGSDPIDHDFDKNFTASMTINRNAKRYLKGDFEVLNNYFLLGALWVTDDLKGSASKNPVLLVTDNQKGALRLANTVLETSFQNIDPNQYGSPFPAKEPFTSNCFGCHGYKGKASFQSNNVARSANGSFNALSHIFDDIIKGQSTPEKSN